MSNRQNHRSKLTSQLKRRSRLTSQLSRQKDFLLEKLNDRLARDEFFEPEDRNASWVEDIILK